MGERGKVGAAAAEKGYDTKPPSHKGGRTTSALSLPHTPRLLEAFTSEHSSSGVKKRSIRTEKDPLKF